MQLFQVNIPLPNTVANILTDGDFDAAGLNIVVDQITSDNQIRIYNTSGGGHLGQLDLNTDGTIDMGTGEVDVSGGDFRVRIGHTYLGGETALPFNTRNLYMYGESALIIDRQDAIGGNQAITQYLATGITTAGSGTLNGPFIFESTTYGIQAFQFNDPVLVRGNGNMQFFDTTNIITANGSNQFNITNGAITASGDITGDALIIPGTTAAASGVIAQPNISTVIFHTFGTDNLFIGSGAGNFDTSGTGQNIGVGSRALELIGTGNTNIAFGANAGRRIVDGNQNALFGRSAGEFINDGQGNVCFGRNAGYNIVDASSNVCIGNNTIGSTSGGIAGTSNVVIGTSALQKGTGGYNVVIGTNALNVHTTGDFNVVLGRYAGLALVAGSNNIYLGHAAGRRQTGTVGVPNNNKLIIDSLGRSSLPNELIQSLIYGTMSTTIANQTLRINGATEIGNATTAQPLGVTGVTTLSDDLIFDTDTKGLAYGSMYAHDTSQTVTIVTINVPVQIPAGFTEGQTNMATFGNAREITVTNAGNYKIDWCLSFTMATGAGLNIEGGIGIDGTYNTQGTAHRYIGTATDTGSMSGTAILDLAAGAVVSLMFKNESGSQNVVMEHGSLSLVQVGG